MNSKKRIFVVDDEEDLTDLLQFQLKREGFKVETANDPFAALTAARDFGPDLIVLDVMMPDLDGYQLLRMFRSDHQLTEVPVVMLTARAGVEDRIKGLESGADDYMCKPFETKELILRIRSILKRSSEQNRAPSGRIVMGNVAIDEEDHSVSLQQHPCFVARLSVHAQIPHTQRIDCGRSQHGHGGRHDCRGQTLEGFHDRDEVHNRLRVNPKS